MGKETRQALVTSVILAAVLLASANVLGVVAGSQHTPSIQSATIEGEGVLERGDDHTTLWNNGSYALGVSVVSRESPYELCTHGVDANATSCQYVRLENGTQTLQVTDLPWDRNTTGQHTLNVTIGSAGSSKVHDWLEQDVRLLDPGADPDGDGLVNHDEVATGTNMSLQDTDRDGLDDGAEVHNYGTDPTSIDSDGDDLTDAREINGRTDPTDPDSDGDGLADGREVNELGTDPTGSDSDDDGLVDAREIEALGTDPLSADTDEDGIDDGREAEDPNGDPTDPTVPDGALTEEVPGLLPAPLGRSMLVAVVVIVAGALAATGISAVRNGRLSNALPSAAGEEEPAADADEPADDGPTAGDRRSDRGSARARETPSTPILTDEERVLQMLHENGGQVKQQRIVSETDWSKSKVSRLLSRMAEDGQVRKITLGRENVIRLPDEESDDEGVDTPRYDRS